MKTIFTVTTYLDVDAEKVIVSVVIDSKIFKILQGCLNISSKV